MLPIKYVEGNLIQNHQGEWWAYYRMNPYNYAFADEDEKNQLRQSLRLLFGQVRAGDIHVLAASAEESIAGIFADSEKYAVGPLRDIALDFLDETQAILTDKLYKFPDEIKKEDYENFFCVDGGTQARYMTYLGFRLLPRTEVGYKGKLREMGSFWSEALRGINHKAMGDYTTISKSELRRYGDAESLLHARISGLFSIQRISTDEVAYILQHLNGASLGPLESHAWHLPTKDSGDGKATEVRRYDVLKLDNSVITERVNYLYIGDDAEPDAEAALRPGTYCRYLTIQEMTDDLDFDGAEFLYEHSRQFDFPVDTSIRVRVLENRTALKRIRGQKKRIKDIIDHAEQTYNDVDGDVDIAFDDAVNLETNVKMNGEPMYEVSYVLRITAPSLQELARREDMLTLYYSGKNINLTCHPGDMLNCHHECMPGGRVQNYVLQNFDSGFLAGIGIGAGTVMGHRTGLPICHTDHSQSLFCLRPWLGAQGVAGTVTNSLSCAFIGGMGGGKSVSMNLVTFYSVLFGARAVIIDPKAERGHWKEAFPQIAGEIDIARLTKAEENRGILDPFQMFDDPTECTELAMDVLSFLLGISIQDAAEWPALEMAVKAVSARRFRGLLMVIDELKSQGTDAATRLALHLQSFASFGLAGLLFSDGTKHNTISLDKRLTIIQVEDLMLPKENTSREDCSAKELLSIAVMMAVAKFTVKFIKAYPEDFKIVGLDEAWSLLNMAQGAQLTNRLDREGRAWQAGVYYSVQNPSDFTSGRTRNSLGMVFVFRLSDREEIVSALGLLGVNAKDESNIQTVRDLGNGECLMRDLYGRVNRIKFDLVVPQMFRAFDTRPESKHEQGE